MRKLIAKYFLVLCVAFLILPACIKDMEINVQNPRREVVVSCLFNPEEQWALTLSRTKILHEDADIFIDDAKVEIATESGENIALAYTGKKGVYTSDSHPEVGKTYMLKINIPGQKEITAKSHVPDLVKITVPDFEVKWVKYLYPNNLLDYDAFPLEVNFGETIKDARFLFRACCFEPKEGYKRYMLTMESLEKLKEAGLPINAYRELVKLADQWFVSQWPFDKILYNFVDDIKLRNGFPYLLHQELKQKTVSAREYEAFGLAACFGNDFWLNNISYDVITVLGEEENVSTANLLYAASNLKYSMDGGQKHGKEYWLEAVRCSKEYSDYYRTYILQVSQRINPYSEPVMVQSNINNATGIFAGFNRQMVHLFDY